MGFSTQLQEPGHLYQGTINMSQPTTNNTQVAVIMLNDNHVIDPSFPGLSVLMVGIQPTNMSTVGASENCISGSVH